MITNAASNTFPSSVAQSNNASKSRSQDQLLIIEETLVNFDPDTLTLDDAITIVETFKDGGIQPGRELEEVMSIVIMRYPIIILMSEYREFCD